MTNISAIAGMVYTDAVDAEETSLDINLDVIPESSLLPLGAC